eukprot:GFYU01003300.1.p1 GENE.GFYU01003300.1~~GFYU01003300.1.p1  ORF type:complete len:282 (-),score=65.61 GFYU01003300.1:295-1140(-)
MDADDSLVHRKVWEGSVPISISLSTQELTTTAPPPPMYSLVSRVTYLSLLIERVREHFTEHAVAGEDQVWFEYDGKPLKWHLPVGALFDTYSNDRQLPWQLTVHFRNFPSRMLVKIQNDDEVLWNYCNTLKEASFLKFGSTKSVMELNKTDEELLWDSLRNGLYENFQKVFPQLYATGQAMRSIPVRVLYGSQTIQRRVSVTEDGGGIQAETLLDVLKEFVPTVFTNVSLTDTNTNQAYVHGVCPPYDTPLQYLCDTLGHPDLFLYISVAQREAFTQEQSQ